MQFAHRYFPFGRIRPGSPTTSYRGVAQLVARLLWEQEARGSSPRTPTKFCRKTACLGGFFCVLSFAFAVFVIAVLRRFKERNSGGGMSESGRRNRQIPNPSLTGVIAVFSLWIRQILEFSSLILYNNFTVSLCATKVAVWGYPHAAFMVFLEIYGL